MSRHIETLLVQAGNRKDAGTGAVSLPIHLSTAYEHKGIGQSTGFDYSRTGNPTRSALEEILAQLEGGQKAYAFSSGMAAVHAVLSLFQSGDELVVSKDLYGGSYRLFKQYEAQYKMKFRFVDTACIEEVEASVTPSTKGIFVETPTNPLMNEAPIREISRVARKHDVLLIVDNTFYTPVIQRPIEEGAHIVVHSATKYLGGHNDVLAGVVVVDSESLAERIYTVQNSIGATLAPLDCWLLIRGMKTLGLRMKQHESNAKQIASYLESHPSITDVLYTGKGGMLSFRLRKEEWVGPFLERLELITFAESLGGVESFITYPATQTHADIPEEERISLGICNRLLRFSVGIENADDLIQDLEQVLTNLEKEVFLYE
ncbi:methionine biosynthesis PLP-dependent protein [Rossellomorea marisflavi]|jgi:cystathionine gamma-synthase|uniref:methionine biosynthesis PLP-dependent protein n=1 Tax=Rossellomorea marisflavi TaxID=189381 RepID=UPI0027A9FB58|nr:methionine biosynthesis PLP-dependent protein [Rossellomorea marisflavi]UTE70955.1 methionine biosynthesis PLP-dependent protein [Rossellomorea marisflavi]